ncbi:MAG: TetR/AcrR family transcriptional regulator [Candidatus Cloacimonetes bacterium]|nr:TetR/AcrR family transcriptional regulator [Candidatus Cloacimonadota bacterium]MCF7813007.1 TetR/AcrR family transcriptional regulator [Candidatus Cloacimonadota bacterium]MCF7867261.1 TetR/AcrR family transcriptional regulator [Candidatus Cloacimonadota bacterium]MCF7882705.1 TetR/AcrR family transcriptional regulator [Candidatus Cloacimonadota bacterium]
MFSERQQQIIETAIKIIAVNGVQNLTTKKLAQEMGLTEPALYRHFDSKLHIMEAIIKYFQNQMQPALQKLQGNSNSIKKIENFIFEHLNIINQNPHYARVIFSEANFQFDESLLIKMKSMMNQSRKMLEDIIQDGQDTNELRSDITSLSISRLVIGSMRLLITQWSMSGMIFNLEAEGRQLCEDIKKIISVG